MPSLRDLVSQARHELEQHDGPEIEDAHDALDTIEAHAEGEHTVEHARDLVDELKTADEHSTSIDLPTTQIADHFGLLDDDVDDQEDDVDEADEPPTLQELTYDQLYELAQTHDVDGRSDMSKAELVEALDDLGAVDSHMA
jgi:hypothetical protein